MSFLLYGATGYTGCLIAEAAVKAGLKPVVAGRSAAPLQALAERLGLPFVVVSLDDDQGLRRALADVPFVIHAAGPFARTSAPMVRACLEVGRDYLDITGEIEVFEALAARSDEARAKNVMLLPGVGFDVVPSDCLLAHVAARLPGARELHLGIQVVGSVSRGTATTAIEHMHEGGALRREGRIIQSAIGSVQRRFDFGRGPRVCVSAPWGDVATSYHSTGVPNVTTYFPVPTVVRLGLPLMPLVRPLLAQPWLQRLLIQRVRARAAGPDEAARALGRAILVATAAQSDGRSVTSRLITPDGYALTVDAALRIAGRVASGAREPGFMTPSRLLGVDFVLELPGTSRVDLSA